MSQTLILGADHAGVELKQELSQVAREQGFEVRDLGAHSNESVDYPDFAHEVAKAVMEDGEALGLLVCGTGQGMSMAANRHSGVRAAVCADVFSAKMARQHNGANVLCLGARVVGPGPAAEILRAFLGSSFEGGRHERRVRKIEPEGSEG